MDENNHYVTVEEYQRLLALAQQKKSGGFVRFLSDVCQMILLAGAIVGGYFLITIFIGEPAALPPPPTNAQGTPYPTAPAQRQPTGGGETSHIYSGGPLPSCDAVTDTRTACQPAPEDGQAPAQPLPTEVIILAPPAVECYKGSFYTCEELAEMGDEGATEAVKETDAFVDVQTLPTPEPAFVEYATNACQAAAVKSPLCP